MVRPRPQDGNVVWGPHVKLDQQAIERAQKRVTRLIPNIKDLLMGDWSTSNYLH